MAGPRRTLVIDASIGVIGHSGSARLRFLDTVLNVCHRFVTTDEILEEWKNHESPIAKRWRARMVARKKWVHLNTAS